MPRDPHPATDLDKAPEQLRHLARELLAKLEQVRTEAQSTNREAHRRWVHSELGEGGYVGLGLRGEWQAAAVAAALERLPENLEEAIGQLRQALDFDPESACRDVMPLIIGAWEDHLARLDEGDAGEGNAD